FATGFGERFLVKKRNSPHRWGETVRAGRPREDVSLQDTWMNPRDTRHAQCRDYRVSGGGAVGGHADREAADRRRSVREEQLLIPGHGGGGRLPLGRRRRGGGGRARERAEFHEARHEAQPRLARGEI